MVTSIPMWKASFLLAPLLAGCVEETRPERYPVLGRVTFEGAPVSDGTVMFHHRDTTAGGKIGADGRFRVTGAGLKPGTYHVAILPPDPFLNSPPNFRDGPPRQRPEFPEFPQKYRSPLSSGIEVVVEETDNYFQLSMLKPTPEEIAAEDEKAQRGRQDDAGQQETLEPLE
jgi:hypothetical protein